MYSFQNKGLQNNNDISKLNITRNQLIVYEPIIFDFCIAINVAFLRIFLVFSVMSVMQKLTWKCRV